MIKWGAWQASKPPFLASSSNNLMSCQPRVPTHLLEELPVNWGKRIQPKEEVPLIGQSPVYQQKYQLVTSSWLLCVFSLSLAIFPHLLRKPLHSSYVFPVETVVLFDLVLAFVNVLSCFSHECCSLPWTSLHDLEITWLLFLPTLEQTIGSVSWNKI